MTGPDPDPGPRQDPAPPGWSRLLGPAALVGLVLTLSAALAWTIRGYLDGRATLNVSSEVSTASGPSDRQAARLRAGQLVYRVHCARCHGPTGQGDGPDAPYSRPKPHDLTSGRWTHGSTPEAVRRVVIEGVPGTSMTAWGGVLTGRELDTVVGYVRSLAPETQSADSLAPGLAAALERAGFRPAISRPVAPPLGIDNQEGRGEPGQSDLVLVVFWGTTCAPCLEHLPDLERLADRYRDRGLVVRPICVDEPDPDLARAVARRHAESLNIEVDRDGRTRLRYDIQTLPVSVLIDGAGHLIGRAEGSPDWSGPAMKELMDACLKPPEKPSAP